MPLPFWELPLPELWASLGAKDQGLDAAIIVAVVALSMAYLFLAEGMKRLYGSLRMGDSSPSRREQDSISDSRARSRSSK